jgi:aryl-alcohol dehydrogenase-like predicted oxidoreductase
VRYRNIPQTDLYPSVLSLGTAPFGTGVDSATAFQLLDTFFAKGGNFIDTARVYGAWVPDGLGLSEKLIGQWLKERNVRESVIISTKGAHPLLSSMHIPRLFPQDIRSDIDESLHDLQTETIDLYWLHRDDPKQSVAAIMETLNDQVAKGKIRYFGCSNWHVPRIEEAMQYATDHAIASFVGDQLMWSFAVPNLDAIEDKTVVTMEAQILDFHRKTGLAVVAYTSQAHGFFSKVNSHPQTLSEQLRKMYVNAENAKRLRRLQVVSQELSLPISVIALAYLTNQSLPTFPIFGCATINQSLENIEAGDVELSTDVVQYLELGQKK